MCTRSKWTALYVATCPLASLIQQTLSRLSLQGYIYIERKLKTAGMKATTTLETTNNKTSDSNMRMLVSLTYSRTEDSLWNAITCATIVTLKPDLYYEKSLRHALRQALRQGKPLSQAVASCRSGLSQKLS